MQVLIKEEYRKLLNKIGSIAKFYIKQIEDIKYNPDFYEAFEGIQKIKTVKIDDKENYCCVSSRIVERDNEAIYLTKNINSYETEYDDKIVYYLMVDFNKKIKMYIDYNELNRNENYNQEIYFEILESYDRKDCGDVYGNGHITYETEEGYKGKIKAEENTCVMHYVNYNHNHLRVTLPEGQYDYESAFPKFDDLNKETITFQMTQGVNNPIFFAFNEIELAKKKQRQRTR